jgi:DNA-binding transcriptional ArsR family regulator
MQAADDLVLDALGDRQRRAIVRLLADRPRPVHELAAALPIADFHAGGWGQLQANS